jgi:hypothetical protein
MSSVVFYRYAFPSVTLAVITLAALGIDRLSSQPAKRRTVGAAALLTLGIIGAAAANAYGLVTTLSSPSSHTIYARVAVGWGSGIVIAAAVAAVISNGRARSRLLAALVVADVCAMFMLPGLSAPRAVHVDLTPVTFLRQHLGLQRFFTLGPIQPEYGAYFGIASINDNDVPVPSAWTRYVNARLDPYVNPLLFVGNADGGRRPSDPSPAQQLLDRLDGYRAAGVAFVVAPAGQELPQSPRTFTLVFRSPSARIYRVAGAAPYFSTSAGGCVIRPESRESARIGCPAPTVLTRRELAMPGWSAQVDGHNVPVRESGGLFQAVDVGAGTHTITFGYSPPYSAWALLALVVGCGWVLLSAPRARVRTVARRTVA